MEGQKLHIIAFDVPYPPNYGGIVDLFFKLKSLHEAGAKIIYHCFHYKGHNPPTEELEEYCQELYFYERKKSLFKFFFSRLPYTIATRNDSTLCQRILANPAPILMDGIQCTYWILHPDLRDQKILYRANNIEHEYYEKLAVAETNWLRRFYLRNEAKKLRNYEWQIQQADAILSVSKQDIFHYEQYAKTYHIPPFLDDTASPVFSQKKDKQKFILFQGNLSVKENENAAQYIIKNVAPLVERKIVIAGRSPSKGIKGLAHLVSNIELIDTPSHAEMVDLIQSAHINLLLTFQQTGIKLKLLHALQLGKHILINSLMDDSGIFAEMCVIIDDPQEMACEIESLMEKEFTKEMKISRDTKFNAIYGNKKKAKDILKIIKGPD